VARDLAALIVDDDLVSADADADAQARQRDRDRVAVLTDGDQSLGVDADRRDLGAVEAPTATTRSAWPTRAGRSRPSRLTCPPRHGKCADEQRRRTRSRIASASVAAATLPHFVVCRWRRRSFSSTLKELNWTSSAVTSSLCLRGVVWSSKFTSRQYRARVRRWLTDSRTPTTTASSGRRRVRRRAIPVPPNASRGAI